MASYPGGTETTMYVGGLLEKMTRGGVTEYRHAILAGAHTALYTRRSDGTHSTYHVTRDHLGSSSAVTDAGGNVLVSESFNAFGERRGSDWSGSPSAADWAQIAATERRGFTDHEHLDNLNLIHMNGRVYDPALGRFLSADPFIDGWGGTQGYNRYSYVKNNPLRFVDPSGFKGCDNREEKCDGDEGQEEDRPEPYPETIPVDDSPDDDDFERKDSGAPDNGWLLVSHHSTNEASSGQAALSGEPAGIRLQLSESLTRPDVRAIAHEHAQAYKAIAGVVIPVVSAAALAGKETIKAILLTATLFGPNPGKPGIALQPTRQMVNAIQRVEKAKSDAGMKLKGATGVKPD